MDTELLVDNRINDGRKLIAELARDGFDVTVAFWAKASEEGHWFLYVGSNSVDPARVGDAYRTVYASLSRIPDLSVGLSDIKLLHASNPIAVAAKGFRARYPGSTPTRIHGKRLADLSIEEAYVYPPLAVIVLAKGKEAVLEFLEKEAQARAGKPGEYLLARDEEGNLVALIAGHSFVGTGTVTIGGKRLDVVDGIVTSIQ